MLLVWLFALLTTWVNACVVQGGGAAVGARDHNEIHSLAAIHDVHHEATNDPGGPTSDGAGGNCESLCGAQQSILVKESPAKGDSPADQAVIQLRASGYRPVVTVARGTAWSRRGLSPPPRLPVAIAFLRLTI